MRRVRAVLQGVTAVLMAAMIAACTQAPAPLSPIIAPPTHTIKQLVEANAPLVNEPVRVEGFFLFEPIGLLCPSLPSNRVTVGVSECLLIYGPRDGHFDFERRLHRAWVRVSGVFNTRSCEPGEICLFHPSPDELAEREKVFGTRFGTYDFELQVDAMERAVPPR